MITREQVADLQPGDVVEISGYPVLQGAIVRGPLVAVEESKLTVGPLIVRHRDGSAPGMFDDECALTVVSRAPRPLYVNHARTEAAPGDVVIPVNRDADDVATWSWCQLRSGVYRWRNTRDDSWLAHEDLGEDLRLLVDGETGQVVP